MTKRTRRVDELQPEIAAFRDTRKTLLLSTLSINGFPHSSYAPFVRLADGYYVLLSELAEHTQNLQQNDRLSFMLAADEADSPQIFARQRLTYRARATVITRNSDTWHNAIAQLQSRFGKIIDTLSGLGDFHLFRLTPETGRYVKDFGRAYTVKNDADLDATQLTTGSPGTTDTAKPGGN